MNRRDALLAMLASGGGQYFSPVQLQKAMFLVQTNVPHSITEGPGFNFVPYDYGPFDANVYNEATVLRAHGEVVEAPAPTGRWKLYAVSPSGMQRGTALLEALPAQQRTYYRNVGNWVRSLSFSQLVKSIYEAYPTMRENSIFQDR